MSSMHSLIWFYDIEALTIFQLAQMAGAEGQGQFGAPNLAQDYLQQWLIIVASLFVLTVLIALSLWCVSAPTQVAGATVPGTVAGPHCPAAGAADQ